MSERRALKWLHRQGIRAKKVDKAQGGMPDFFYEGVFYEVKLLRDGARLPRFSEKQKKSFNIMNPWIIIFNRSGKFLKKIRYNDINLLGRGFESWKDYDWMHDRYWKDRLSLRKIAKAAGCTKVTIIKWLRVHGIPTCGCGDKNPRWSPFLNPQP